MPANIVYFQDLDIDLNSVSHHDETSESEELLTSLNVETPVTFFLQTGNSFHTPSYFKVRLPFPPNCSTLVAFVALCMFNTLVAITEWCITGVKWSLQ